MWVTEGVKSSPGAGTCLADTGQLAAQEPRECRVQVSATVSAHVRVEHRNAANNANVESQDLWVSATSPWEGVFKPNMSNAEERVRVVTVDALTFGSVQASLHYT